MSKCHQILTPLEMYYLRRGVLRAYFKRMNRNYMIKVVFGE